MIKHNLLFVISCLLFLNSAYSSTEVKAPEGPFISQLRATFSLSPEQGFIAKKAAVKEKVYNFQVPDLGRYQERSSPASVSFEEKPTENAFSFEQDDMFKPIFDESAFSHSSTDKSPSQISPYAAVHNQNFLQQPKQKMSFDAMPISSNPVSDLSSYPAEWSQLNPLGSFEGAHQRGVNNMATPNNNFRQNTNSMRMPFSMQRPHQPAQPMNNNSNYGYK